MSSGAHVHAVPVIRYRAECDRFGCRWSMMFDDEVDAATAALTHNEAHRLADEREDRLSLDPDEAARYNGVRDNGGNHYDAMEAALS